MTLVESIDKDRIPRHIAIIMDGNGRWAQQNGLPRSQGHAAGYHSVQAVTEAAVRIGVDYLTLYTFSLENWNRPTQEVTAIMSLLATAIENETPTLMKNNVRLQLIGDISRIPATVCESLNRCVAVTGANTGLTLVLALSYSARWEMVEAARTLAEAVQKGTIEPGAIDDTLFAQALTTAKMPDPDLLIRTGGELRISNFLLWQAAYAELYFTDLFWPDFGEEAFYQAVLEYQQRERRFGKTGDQIKTAENRIQQIKSR